MHMLNKVFQSEEITVAILTLSETRQFESVATSPFFFKMEFQQKKIELCEVVGFI